QAGLPTVTFSSMPGLLNEVKFEEQVGNSLIVREAIGVVGCITPWNYPLHQIAAKVAPALAAGCTVVLKPSEVTPLNAFILAEIIEEVGLPAGVFNLVTGTGPTVGEAIAGHPDIDMVSFTGSARWCPTHSVSAYGATSRRGSTREPSSSPAGPTPPRDSTRAISSSPPSSPRSAPT